MPGSLSVYAPGKLTVALVAKWVALTNDTPSRLVIEKLLHVASEPGAATAHNANPRAVYSERNFIVAEQSTEMHDVLFSSYGDLYSTRNEPVVRANGDSC